jgi:hypothetical protein
MILKEEKPASPDVAQAVYGAPSQQSVGQVFRYGGLVMALTIVVDVAGAEVVLALGVGVHLDIGGAGELKGDSDDADKGRGKLHDVGEVGASELDRLPFNDQVGSERS